MKRTDLQSPLRGDSQLVPNDRNAVVGGKHFKTDCEPNRETR